jgi:hypothetical protein
MGSMVCLCGFSLSTYFISIEVKCSFSVLGSKNLASSHSPPSGRLNVPSIGIGASYGFPLPNRFEIHEDDMEHGVGKPPFFDGTNYLY